MPTAFAPWLLPDQNTPWVKVNLCAKFGPDRPSHFADYKEHTHRRTQLNTHDAKYVRCRCYKMSLYNTIHDEILDEINREWDMYITSKAEQDLQHFTPAIHWTNASQVTLHCLASSAVIKTLPNMGRGTKTMNWLCSKTQITHARYSASIFSCIDAQWQLAVWLSINALASINVVALHQTRLLPGWVTICGCVNHLSM